MTRRLFYAALGVLLISIVVFTVFGRMNPLDATYFAVTTLTTVGYGDINLQWASSGLKVFGICLMLSGAAILATIYAIVADRVLATRVELLLGLRGVHRVGHTVVVGLGRVGFWVANEMYALGVDIVAIEPHADTEKVAEARALFPVVVGDASHMDVLKRACVDQADVILALTNKTVLNLNVALRAKELNPSIRTVIRTHEPALSEHFRELGLDAVVSTAAISAPAFADAALNEDVVATFYVGSTEVQLVKEPADSQDLNRLVFLADQGGDCFHQTSFDDPIPTKGFVYAVRAVRGRSSS
jgi:Trk K+ transport system NAD-binding subunit